MCYLLDNSGGLFVFVDVLQKKTFQPLENYPEISILVAARNEAHQILDCLESLNQMDYDHAKVEFLIGNDQSTDDTQQVVEQYIADKPHFKLINLTGNEHPQTKGKARVLACLGEHAKGEYLLITDADIQVNKMWAKGLVAALVQQKVDLIGGTTLIQTNHFFEKFQQVDWLYFMGIINVLDALKHPITMVGNNMAFSNKAYQSVGGYQTIPFSITEDYALFKSFRQKKYQSAHVLNSETLVFSSAIDTFIGILKQRKRWLVGGWDLPFIFRALLFLFASWYFVLPILFFFNWKLALLLFIIKCFLQLFQILMIYQHLETKPKHWIAILLYDLYLFFIIPASGIYFLMPAKTVWKGRQY